MIPLILLVTNGYSLYNERMETNGVKHLEHYFYSDFHTNGKFDFPKNRRSAIMSKEINIIGAEELDILFDEGEEDILQYFDMENAVRLGDEQEKVTLSLPKWMSDSIDGEAKRLGVTRQAIIKIWLDEKLQGISA
jgi:hypothetical protein